MKLSMVLKILKGKTASLNLLVYFETVQKATVSTAEAEIVIVVISQAVPNVN